MVRYVIYDKKIALKKGLDKAFLRSVPKLSQAKVYTNDDPSRYIIKKVTQKQYDSLLKRRRH